MRQMIPLAMLLALAATTFAQHITESPMSHKKRLSGLFSSKSAIISMTLQREFEVDATDTTYSFVVSVAETEADISNVSIGFTSFLAGGLSGAAANTSATIKTETKFGVAKLDKSKFMQFYQCVNKVYKAAGTMAALKKDINALCTCGVEGIQFGGEYIPDAIEKQKFYFELGDAAFGMTRPEFEVIVKFVYEVKLVLDKK